jgi:DnaJ-class molecular chaperone
MFFRVGSLLIVLLMFGVVSLAEIIICKGCGWELDGGAAACGHCGRTSEKRVESATEAPVEVEKLEISPEGQALADDLIDEDVRLSRQYTKAGDPVVARLLIKNASVIMLISESARDTTRTTAIAKMLASLTGRGTFVDAKCTSCDGSGKRVMTISSIIPGEPQSREVQGGKCPFCKGRGSVRRAGSMDDLKFSRSQAEKRFEAIQRGRGYQRVGGVWLPGDVMDTLKVKQRAMISAASSPPCETCEGFGKVDCKACEARGVIECAACDGGNVFIKVTGELVKGTISRSEKCKKCKGRGVLYCEKCGGSGGILCRKCRGKGDMPDCRKCAQKGYIDCRKCKGSGKIDDEDCEYCAGEGVILCTSCDGDGHR